MIINLLKHKIKEDLQLKMQKNQKIILLSYNQSLSSLIKINKLRGFKIKY